MKVGIVGMGWVGASVALSTLQSGIATELVVHDQNVALAEGEALDLGQGAVFYPSASVRAAAVDEMTDADAVVIAAGRGGRPDESRLDLVRDNAAIIDTIARQLTRLRGLLVIVTNPVDIMTRVATEASGLPPSRVVGTGTMLDTARLRQMVGRKVRLDPRSIHAQVIGEHGDSEVVLWSSARIGGVPLRDWPGWVRDHELPLASEVRRAAYEIIARKGATNHAIGLVTAAFLRTALRNERRVLTVSRVQDGAFGIRDVAISLPSVVGIDGATQILEPPITSEEKAGLERSVDVLRQAAAQLQVDDPGLGSKRQGLRS